MAKQILLGVLTHNSATYYFASAQYCTRNSDTPANTLFDGRILVCDYERGITFPYWTRSSTTTPIRAVDFVNSDRYFDSMLGEVWKNDVFDLYLVEELAAFSTAVRVGRIIVDNVSAPDIATFRLNGYSYFEQIDVAVTTKFSDSITNVSLRSKTIPLALGKVRWMYPANSRLNDYPTSAVRGLNNVADGPFESLVELRNRGGLAGLPGESQNHLVTGDDYFVVQDSAGYGYLYAALEYRHAAEVRGQLRLGTDLVTNATFPTDSDHDEVPDGFTLFGTGGSCTFNAAGSVTLVADGTDDLLLCQDIAVTIAAVYYVVVEVTNLTGVVIIEFDGVTLRSVDSVGLYTIAVGFEGARTGSFSLKVGFLASAAGTLDLAAIHLYEAWRIDNLSEVLRFAAVTRGPLSTGELDLTTCDAIFTETPYTVSYGTDNELKGGELLSKVALSYGCCFYQTRFGKLKPIRLQEPAVTADYTIVQVEIDGSVQYEPDLAPGLSTRLNYAYNPNVHSTDDMVLAPATTAGNPEIRAELSSEYKTVTSTVTLHAAYAADAAKREPLPSILKETADAQAEVDRSNGLYTVQRGFYSVRVERAPEEAYLIEPGDTVNVYYPAYGLTAGKNLLVVYARSSFIDGTVDLQLWG